MNDLIHWREQLDERQRKAVAFAETYIRDFNHGTVGHNDLVLIARLAELLDVAAGLKAPPEPPAPGDIRLTFGKYRDQTLGGIFQHDPDYIAWLVREARDETVKAAAQLVLALRSPRSVPAADDQEERGGEIPF